MNSEGPMDGRGLHHSKRSVHCVLKSEAHFITLETNNPPTPFPQRQKKCGTSELCLRATECFGNVEMFQHVSK